MKFWDKVNSVEDLKSLTERELIEYADEVRQHIIDSVKITGGHLASNLGAVEMTLAIHYVYNCPKDKIIFDVGHQSYTHKIVTGRRDKMGSLRQNGGISGFTKMSESDCDAFTMGHSSTSLSVATGLARARDLKGEKHDIACVIGDGAFTGGLAFEAINDIGANGERMVIILNDNKMSISDNVGAMSNYLAKLRMSKRYSKFKINFKKGISAVPFFGDKLVRALDKTKDAVKNILIANKLFENFGVKYLGPFDGHNIPNLIKILRQAKNSKKPVLVHVVTNKGNGLSEAESDPKKYHGLSGEKDKRTGIPFAEIFGRTLEEMAEHDDKIIGVTAAMGIGTGLEDFAKAFPERFFDVGIAEEHAVTMSAGLAADGFKPYFAVYSSFLQRAFDQILHDVCLNKLPVTFMIDRAGAVGADGVTHQGIFDLSYLNLIPNITVCTPKDGRELIGMIKASSQFNLPLAIRYPKDFITDYDKDAPFNFKWEQLKSEDNGVYILAAGNRMLDIASKINANIINARVIKPLDEQLLQSINLKNNLIITMEDNIRKGGFGEAVLSYLNKDKRADIEIIAYADDFLDDYDVDSSLIKGGMSVENINAIIKSYKK